MDTDMEGVVVIGSIGHHIRSLRVSKGMTQAQLGAIMGIGPDAVELMESSFVPELNSDAIRHLSETFNAYPRTFLYGSDEEFFAKTFDFGAGGIDAVRSFLATPMASQLLGRDIGVGAFEALMRIGRLNDEGIVRAVSLIADLGKIADYRKEDRSPPS